MKKLKMLFSLLFISGLNTKTHKNSNITYQIFRLVRRSSSVIGPLEFLLWGDLKRPRIMHIQDVTEELGETFRHCDRKGGFSVS